MKGKSQILQGLYQVVNNYYFVQNTSGPGISWIELYLLALAHCPNPNEMLWQRVAKQRPLIYRTLKAFRLHGTQLMKFMLSPAYAHLYDGVHNGSNRLEHYGFTTRLPHTKVIPVLHPSVAKYINRAMLNLTSPLNKKQVTALEQGQLLLKTHKFTGYGSFKCQLQIKELCKLVTLHHNNKVVTEVQTTVCEDNVSFKCPLGHTRAAKLPFDPVQPGKTVRCGDCGRPHISTKWRCPCDTIWVNCQTHRNIVVAQPPLMVPSKRVSGQFSEEASAKRLATLERREGPARGDKLKLGAKLSVFFPHLARGAGEGNTSR